SHIERASEVSAFHTSKVFQLGCALRYRAVRCFGPWTNSTVAPVNIRVSLRRRALLRAGLVAVSFLPASNGVKRGRDESTRRARAPGAALVRQAQDRSRDHPRGTAPTGRVPRAPSAAAAKGYAGDTRCPRRGQSGRRRYSRVPRRPPRALSPRRRPCVGLAGALW